MTKTLDAIYDGNVLRLDEPIDLKANTKVRITIEAIDPVSTKKGSFLRTAQSLNLDGPPDWSARFEDYLYDRKKERND